MDDTRVVGVEASSALVLPPSRRFRLAFAKARVSMLARNHGREPIPSGPSPGKPRVLSNRSSNPRRSGTAWDPRSCGGSPLFCGKTSLGWGEAVWPPRESRGPAGLLLGGHWVRPSVPARGGSGAPPAALAALAVAAPFGALAFGGAATSTTTLPSVVGLTAP